MAPQEIQNRRMAFLGHLAEIAVSAALDEEKLGVRYFCRKYLGRLHVVAGAALVRVLAADDDQGRRFDIMDEMGGFVALPRDYMAKVTFERRHFVDDQLLIFLHD